MNFMPERQPTLEELKTVLDGITTSDLRKMGEITSDEQILLDTAQTPLTDEEIKLTGFSSAKELKQSILNHWSQDH